MLKIENSQNMDSEYQKISDSVDFESYIDAVKENQITWKFFIRLMDDLANNMNRQKLLISILLKEFKNYMDLLMKTKDFQNMESMIQKSKSNEFGIQKSKFNEFGIQKSQIHDARESMIQKSKFDEFDAIQDEESMVQEVDEKFSNVDEIQDDFSYIQNLSPDYSSIGINNSDEEEKNTGLELEIQNEESIFEESTTFQDDNDQDNINDDAIETEIKSEPNDEDPMQAQWATIWKKKCNLGKTHYLPQKG